MAQNNQVNAIHNLSSLDIAIMLPLNNTHAKETSALDEAGFTALLDMAFYARGIDRGATAFLTRWIKTPPTKARTSFGSRRPVSPLSTLIALLF